MSATTQLRRPPDPEQVQSTLIRSFKYPYFVSSELFDGFNRFDDVLDVGRDERIIGDPGVADVPLTVDHEDGPAAHAVPAAEGFVFEIVDPELADDLAVEVADQGEGRLQVAGEGRVGAIAFDTHAQNARAEGRKSGVVLTEPLQLEGSNTAEVERIPRQHHGAAGEILGQVDGSAG